MQKGLISLGVSSFFPFFLVVLFSLFLFLTFYNKGKIKYQIEFFKLSFSYLGLNFLVTKI